MYGKNEPSNRWFSKLHVTACGMVSFAIVITFVPNWSSGAIFNRYSPSWSKPERYTLNRTVNVKIELLASFGANEKMKHTAKQAIMKTYTGTWPNTGDESDYIGSTMERHFGGVWMVAMFDIDFDAAYTIVRRSPSYLLYGVNDRAVLIAREGKGERKNGHKSMLLK